MGVRNISQIATRAREKSQANQHDGDISAYTLSRAQEGRRGTPPVITSMKLTRSICHTRIELERRTWGGGGGSGGKWVSVKFLSTGSRQILGDFTMLWILRSTLELYLLFIEIQILYLKLCTLKSPHLGEDVFFS